MSTIQEVFHRIKETRQKAKEVRKMFKDTLASNSEYQEILEKLETLKARKKAIETEVREDTSANFRQLDAYRMHIKNDNELISDLAINQLMSGETVEIVDADNNRYEPHFSVKFKKA